jgi:hypothetical protein
MPNPYFTSVDPYQMPEQQGLMPTFQNIGQQQANQQAALAQQNQLVQQAGMTQKQGGNDPMALAAMLRKKKPEDLNLKGDNTYFGSNSNGMGAGESYSGMNAELGL